ncbi:MAG TPA: glycosyltransferase [Alphaproteobacteria bacterium]|nr:glycosyltransferase [Alphaproteobacteria bacterium]
MYQAMLQNVRIFLTLSDISKYEESLFAKKRQQVLFQTRLWDPAIEKGDWVDSCNKERIELVRALREGLGEQFVGGLIFSPYTKNNYPDLLSNLTSTSKCRRPKFIGLSKQFLIRVNIGALFNAIPFSMGETLAANSCIVSHAVRNSCASDLVKDKHYLSFETPSECVEQCKYLLSHPDRAAVLREEARSYYNAHVRPKESMRLYLNKSME